MNTSIKQISRYFILATLFIFTTPVLAKTQIEIDYDTASFKNEKLKAGNIEVAVSYDKKEEFDEVNNLRYQILYNGVPQITNGAYTRLTGGVFLQDLDGNGIAEVVVRTFSGGAHCCTNYTIYTLQNHQFMQTETGFLDGIGGTFQDLNKDGKIEFLTSDNSFLYAFSSYAGSFAPSRIYTFINGKFNNVTRQYPQYLKSRAWEMYQAFLQSRVA